MRQRRRVALKADPRTSFRRVVILAKALLREYEKLSPDEIVHWIAAIECDLAEVKDIYDDEA